MHSIRDSESDVRTGKRDSDPHYNGTRYARLLFIGGPAMDGAAHTQRMTRLLAAMEEARLTLERSHQSAANAYESLGEAYSVIERIHAERLVRYRMPKPSRPFPHSN
jgi:hypothetical protein